MDPFELFQSTGIYKLAILYFSRSRGLAIVGCHKGEEVEVIQISGEVDPHTGNFTALDYFGPESRDRFPIISKADFENLVAFIETRIDDHTRMSIIEPQVIKEALCSTWSDNPTGYLH